MCTKRKIHDTSSRRRRIQGMRERNRESDEKQRGKISILEKITKKSFL